MYQEKEKKYVPLKESYLGQSCQKFISGQGSSQNPFVLAVKTHGTLLFPTGCMWIYTLCVLFYQISETHLEYFTAFIWANVYSKAKHRKLGILFPQLYGMFYGIKIWICCYISRLSQDLQTLELESKVAVGLGHWPWKKQFSDIRSKLGDQKSGQVLSSKAYHQKK